MDAWPDQRWTRIGSIRGSGRVGSRVRFKAILAGRVGSRVRLTFYRTFLCIIFHHLYSYCCHLVGQNSTDQCVVQDQITSDGYR